MVIIRNDILLRLIKNNKFDNYVISYNLILDQNKYCLSTATNYGTPLSWGSAGITSLYGTTTLNISSPSNLISSDSNGNTVYWNGNTVYWSHDG